MKPKEKAVDQYIREKHTQEECIAYIQGWEDAGREGYNTSEGIIIKALYWVYIGGIITGSILTLIWKLI